MAMDELLASIQTYQAQLEQIEVALASAGEAEKPQLQELQANLLQLLDLTLQQLNTQQHTPADNTSANTPATSATTSDTNDQQSGEDSSSGDKNFDDEFAMFQSEIAELEAPEDKDSDKDSEDDENGDGPSRYSREEVAGWEGSKCRAPWVEKWGGHTYHNAVVLSVGTKHDGSIDLHDPQVVVLFSQPTSLDMLTCRFYLAGHCKFSDDQCRFSHGVQVPLADIKEFREPDLERILAGSRVLVPKSSDIWTSAKVTDVLEDRSAFCVQLDHNKEVMEVKLEQMVPLDQHLEDDPPEDDQGQPPERVNDDSDSEDDNPVFVPSDNWFQHALTKRLGEWEKHTSGIASKLMAKMGYVVGTGLGPTGEGRVEPVTAYVYPQGVSLDRCMELREASNGEEMLQVEKRLDRQRRIEEAKSAQAAERLSARTSLFDIINNKLAQTGSDTPDEPDKPRLSVCKKVLGKDTTKDLNRKNYQLGANIRQLEREIVKLQESKGRQSSNKAAVGLIDAKLSQKQQELRKAQDAERKVQGEQQKRRDAKKLCIF